MEPLSPKSRADPNAPTLSGPLAWSGYVLTKSAEVRAEYISEVTSLPADTPRVVRSALKETYRLKTPQPIREIVQRIRPGTGPRSGSGGRVNVTNPRADVVGRTMGRIGNVATLAVVAIEVYNVYTAPEGRKLQYTAGASGRFMGAITGGKAGAWAGTKIGVGIALAVGQAGPQVGVPEEVVTVPISGIVGGFVGGIGGAIGGAWIGGPLTEEVYILVTPSEGRF